MRQELNELNDSLVKVKTYVGSDGKLHFVDASGADTVLPFNSGIENIEYLGSGNLVLTTTTYIGHYLQITSAMAEYKYLILFTRTDAAEARPYLWGENGTEIVTSSSMSYCCAFIVKNPTVGDRLISARNGSTGSGWYMLFGIK